MQIEAMQPDARAGDYADGRRTVRAPDANGRPPIWITPMSRIVYFAALCLAIAGCTRLGTRLERHALPAGAPAVEAILADLAANDAAIGNFRATGTFVLKSPELTATQQLRESSIQFRRPSDLHVIGRKYAKTVFRLTCVGTKFLVAFPTEKQYYYSAKGEKVKGVPANVSPADIAQEMFLPEVWAKLSPRQVRMIDFDASRQTATLEILSSGLRKRPHRRLVVEGTPWVVRRSELLARDGSVLAVTLKDEYHEQEGLRFPARVESTFPGQDALMRFEMRKEFLNTELEADAFDLERQYSEVREKGYERVEPSSEKENAL